MKRLLHSIAFLVLLYGCAAVMTQDRSWSFVTSVGGLELATPFQIKKRWVLPVRADVSGLQAITNQPTTLNSGLVCDKTKAHVEGRDILVVIVTTVPHGDASSRCPAANLGALAPGQYDIFYGSNRAEGVRLGTMEVAL